MATISGLGSQGTIAQALDTRRSDEALSTQELGSINTSTIAQKPAAKETTATWVTLSPEAILKLDHGEEVRRDPFYAVQMFRQAFIEMDYKHLAWLESDAEVINLATGKPVTPEVREKLKASTRESIEGNKAVLKLHLGYAAGIDPARETNAVSTVSPSPSFETGAPDALARELAKASSAYQQSAKEVSPDLAGAARKATSQPNSGTLLLDILTKGNEAYLAAAKKRAAF